MPIMTSILAGLANTPAGNKHKLKPLGTTLQGQPRPAPVSPSPVQAALSPPTPAGQYAAGLKAGQPLMTNEQAVNFHNTVKDPVLGTGHMPRTTVGGAFGQTAGPRLGMRDIMLGTDPARTAGSGQAIADRLQENPGGRFFQGAMLNPSTEQYPGKSAFVDPGRPAGNFVSDATSQFQAAAKAAADRGMGYFDASTGRHLGRDPRNATGTPNPAVAATMGNDAAQRSLQAAGGLPTTMVSTTGGAAASPVATALAGPNPARQRYADALQERRDAVTANAEQRGEARRFRLGDLTPEERLGFADPRGAMMRDVAQAQNEFKGRELDQQNTLARDELNLRRELGQGNIDVAKAGADARNRAAQQEVAGNILGAIPQLVQSGAINAEQGRQMAGQAMSQLQGGNGSPVQQSIQGQPAQQSLETLAPIQRQGLMATPPEQREDYLIGQGLPRGIAAQIAAEANGENPNAPGFFDSPIGQVADVFSQGMASPIHGLFAPAMPEPARPTRRPQGSELTPSPDDTPAQKRAKEAFRKQDAYIRGGFGKGERRLREIISGY